MLTICCYASSVYTLHFQLQRIDKQTCWLTHTSYSWTHVGAVIAESNVNSKADLITSSNKSKFISSAVHVVILGISTRSPIVYQALCLSIGEAILLLSIDAYI